LEKLASNVAELPKRESSDVIKILFWSVVLVCCLLAVAVALFIWYFPPTIEKAVPQRNPFK